ncbi:MAG: 3TM-type holin [Desulfobacterales bacterium]
MAWYSKIFSAVGVDLASTVGKVIDELVTSDEEMALTKNQKLKIQTAYEVRMRELLVKLDNQQAEHEENLESELTGRLKLDMKSDSWLSKNVRPMALIFMTITVSILAFFTVFDSALTEIQLKSLKEWIPFFSTLMMVIYGFYFGSRGIEKVQKIRAAGKTEREKTKKQTSSIDQEPKG